MGMSVAVTKSVRVEVASAYVAERSSPEDNQYFFAYTVRISNEGERTVQLLTRHWTITDGRGHIEEVRGPGVIGQQPVILPGRKHEYSSGVPLETPSGFMTGSYHMKSAGGEEFEVKIPLFALESPFAERRVH